jgi:hypothetical protein
MCVQEGFQALRLPLTTTQDYGLILIFFIITIR